MPTFIRDVLIRIFSMTYKERESKKNVINISFKKNKKCLINKHLDSGSN